MSSGSSHGATSRLLDWHLRPDQDPPLTGVRAAPGPTLPTLVTGLWGRSLAETGTTVTPAERGVARAYSGGGEGGRLTLGSRDLSAPRAHRQLLKAPAPRRCHLAHVPRATSIWRATSHFMGGLPLPTPRVPVEPRGGSPLSQLPVAPQWPAGMLPSRTRVGAILGSPLSAQSEFPSA